MKIETLIINFESQKTEKEIYQIVLGNLNEMIYGLGDNVELLQQLKDELREKLALTSNRHYHALRRKQEDEINHAEIIKLSLKNHTSPLDLSVDKLNQSGK